MAIAVFRIGVVRSYDRRPERFGRAAEGVVLLRYVFGEKRRNHLSGVFACRRDGDVEVVGCSVSIRSLLSAQDPGQATVAEAGDRHFLGRGTKRQMADYVGI